MIEERGEVETDLSVHSLKQKTYTEYFESLILDNLYETDLNLNVHVSNVSPCIGRYRI